ncbi:MAG: hypothetical protein HOP30_08850 [Cyclobacteriaceae bacterium]|nr:hypothetical protein [Cyclobacteriaceae bacterium]
MKVILVIASCLFISKTFGQVQALTFSPLKEWNISKETCEVSYILTKGTYYCLDTRNLISGKFILENSNRTTILTQDLNDVCITWRVNQTGIFYLRFTDTNSGLVFLGFNRAHLQFAKAR